MVDTVAMRTFGGSLWETYYNSLALAVAEIPAAGGVTLHLASKVHKISSQILINKPNVRIVGDGNAVLQRQPGYNGAMLTFNSSAVNGRIDNVLFDGNQANLTGITNPIEVAINGANTVVQNCKFYNTPWLGLGLVGNTLKVKACYFVGMGGPGADNGTRYGIWSNSSFDVDIEGCTFTNWTEAAILMGNANKLRIRGNYFGGNYTQYPTVPGGGQIAVGGLDILIANNNIDAPGSANGSGMELNGNVISVLGNIIHGGNYGIAMQQGQDYIIADNHVINTVFNAIGALSIAGGVVTNFSIRGNRIYTDNGSTTTHGINVAAMAADHYLIEGNTIYNCTNPLIDNGTGINKRIKGNLPLSIAEVN